MAQPVVAAIFDACRTLLDAILGVGSVGVCRPDRRVHRPATERLARTAARLAFVASHVGFRVVWINRGGLPDQYGLRGHVTELADLAALPAHLAQ